MLAPQSIVLLALVLIPDIGHWRMARAGGSTLGAVTFQPSEFAKLALLVALAWYGEHYRRQMGTWKRGHCDSRPDDRGGDRA